MNKAKPKENLWVWCALITSLTLMILMSGVDIHLSYQPSFKWNVELNSERQVVGWRVISSNDTEFANGALLVALESGDQWLPLDENVLLPTLDFAQNLDHIVRSLRIDHALFEQRKQLVRFRAQSGAIFESKIEPKRLSDFGFDFWIYRVLNLSSLIFALFVLCWKRERDSESADLRRRKASRKLLALLFVTSSLTVVFPVAAADRSWGLPADYIWYRFLGNMGVVLLSSFLYLLILSRNPFDILRGRFQRTLLYSVALLYFSPLVLLFFYVPSSIQFLQIITSLLPLLSGLLMYFQWRESTFSHARLADKICIRTVLVYSLFLAFSFSIFHVISKNFWLASSYSPNALLGVGGFFANLILFVMVFRNDLNKIIDWWWLAYVGLIASLVFMGAMAINSAPGGTNSALALVMLMVGVLGCGFVAAWLQYRSVTKQTRLLKYSVEFMNNISEQMFASDKWIRELGMLLKLVFVSNTFEVSQNLPSKEDSVKEVQVIEDGELMVIPIDYDKVIRLAAPDRARRLFNKSDIANAKIVCELVLQKFQSEHAFVEGKENMRRLVAEDLSHNIGMRLKHLAQNDHDNARDYAQKTLSQLRVFTRSLNSSSQTVDEVFSDIIHELSRECEPKNIFLQPRLTLAEGIKSRFISSISIVKIRSILNELFRNAMSGREVSIVEFTVSIDESVLDLIILNDGSSVDINHWVPGTGIDFVKRRVESMEGSISWSQDKNKKVSVVVTIATDKLIET